MPDEGNAGAGHHDLVRERYRLPVQLRINHVRLEAGERVAPAVGRQVGDVPERQRPDRVVPVGLAHPQPVQLMALLFQREHAVGVIGQFAGQHDLEPGLACRRGAPRAFDVELGRFVDRIAAAGMETQGPGDPVVLAEQVDAAHRLLHQLVPLHGMVHPFATDLPGCGKRTERA
jgi:hypothetical protein